MSRIAVIGDWQNAWVTAACLSSFGHQVTLVSRAVKLDLYEPGLDSLLRIGEATGNFRRVHPEQYFDAHAQRDEYGWIALDTPLDREGGPDAEPVCIAAGQAIIRCDKLIVSSQVPLGFCKKLEDFGLPVAYVPENMRLGDGVDTFLRPDRLVIGATDRKYAEEIARLLCDVNVHDTMNCAVEPMLVDLPTAEMIKHATNAYLATSISLANELAGIGLKFGVNAEAVERALKVDSRIGPKAYVRAGAGFAGGTLERDVRALQRLGETRILDAVLAVNAERAHPWAASCRCQTCWESSRD